MSAVFTLKIPKQCTRAYKVWNHKGIHLGRYYTSRVPTLDVKVYSMLFGEQLQSHPVTVCSSLLNWELEMNALRHFKINIRLVSPH